MKRAALLTALLFIVLMSFCAYNCVAEQNTTQGKTDSELREAGGQQFRGQWVTPGMNSGQVKAAWGEPVYQEIVSSFAENWIYEGEGQKFTVEYDDGKVDRIWSE